MKESKVVKLLKERKMSLFVVVSALIMLIGLSYAWLQITLKGENDLVLRAGTLELNLDDSMEGGISLADVVPVSDKVGLASEGYTFTLENTGTIDSKYELYLDDLDLSDADTRMSDSFIKYQLAREDEIIGYDLLSSIGAHPKRMLDSFEIAPGEKYTYKLKMWIDASATNEVMGTVFKGQLRIEAMQGEGVELYKKIAKEAVPDDIQSEFVTASTGVDFSQISSNTNGKGVYTLSSTKNDKYPVYYYRGAVTNNNIKFANFCWKIVRTTEAGGVKLIYNGLPNASGWCSNTTGESTTLKRQVAFLPRCFARENKAEASISEASKGPAF